MNPKVSASIVIYNNNFKILKNLLINLIESQQIDKIFVIDNHFSNNLNFFSFHDNIEYFHNPLNPGFGTSHNFAIKNAIKNSFKYHFIINPDVIIDSSTISVLIKRIINDPQIGQIMPKILNHNGTNQNLPKLLPTPFKIFLRKIPFPFKWYEIFIKNYELRDALDDFEYNVPIISGCFTLLNLEAIINVGMYDEKFFMYFEDWDLSRRIQQKYKNIYCTKVSVVHGYESGANKSFKLFIIFIKSAIYYFNKWGWVFDKERKKINTAAIKQLNR